MRGNFTIGLMEILAYLIPGTFLLIGITFRFPGLHETLKVGSIDANVVLIVLGFLTGHILTMVSYVFVKLRIPIVEIFVRRTRANLSSPKKGSKSKKTSKKGRQGWWQRLKPKVREQRFTFYEQLCNDLKATFGNEISRVDEYLFSLRVVQENLPATNQSVERLISLMLLSRNLATAFFVLSGIPGWSNQAIPLASLTLAWLILVRYVQLELNISNVVFRGAHYYFRLTERNRINEPKNGQQP